MTIKDAINRLMEQDNDFSDVDFTGTWPLEPEPVFIHHDVPREAPEDPSVFPHVVSFEAFLYMFKRAAGAPRVGPFLRWMDRWRVDGGEERFRLRDMGEGREVAFPGGTTYFWWKLDNGDVLGYNNYNEWWKIPYREFFRVPVDTLALGADE